MCDMGLGSDLIFIFSIFIARPFSRIASRMEVYIIRNKKIKFWTGPMSPFCYLSCTLYMYIPSYMNLLPTSPHPFTFQNSVQSPARHLYSVLPSYNFKLVSKVSRKNWRGKTLSYLNSFYINFYPSYTQIWICFFKRKNKLLEKLP